MFFMDIGLNTAHKMSEPTLWATSQFFSDWQSKCLNKKKIDPDPLLTVCHPCPAPTIKSSKARINVYLSIWPVVDITKLSVFTCLDPELRIKISEMQHDPRLKVKRRTEETIMLGKLINLRNDLLCIHILLISFNMHWMWLNGFPALHIIDVSQG